MSLEFCGVIYSVVPEEVRVIGMLGYHLELHLLVIKTDLTTPL